MPEHAENELNETPLTVGQIRAALNGLPDDAQAFVGVAGHLPDYAITHVWWSQQIPWSNETWSEGDPTVTGAEFHCWTESEPTANRRQEPSPAATQAEVANAFVEWAAKNEIAEPPLDWAWFGEIARRYSPLHEQHEKPSTSPVAQDPS